MSWSDSRRREGRSGAGPRGFAPFRNSGITMSVSRRNGIVLRTKSVTVSLASDHSPRSTACVVTRTPCTRWIVVVLSTAKGGPVKSVKRIRMTSPGRSVMRGMNRTVMRACAPAVMGSTAYDASCNAPMRGISPIEIVPLQPGGGCQTGQNGSEKVPSKAFKTGVE